MNLETLILMRNQALGLVQSLAASEAHFRATTATLTAEVEKLKSDLDSTTRALEHERFAFAKYKEHFKGPLFLSLADQPLTFTAKAELSKWGIEFVGDLVPLAEVPLPKELRRNERLMTEIEALLAHLGLDTDHGVQKHQWWKKNRPSSPTKKRAR